jgi:hypothetical protein
MKELIDTLSKCTEENFIKRRLRVIAPFRASKIACLEFTEALLVRIFRGRIYVFLVERLKETDFEDVLNASPRIEIVH